MADRYLLANLLQELAVLLELNGDNFFKIKAVTKAARTLENATCSLQEILDAPPPGFGKGLLGMIREFMTSGYLQELEHLRRILPAELRDMLDIRGLGPKKIRQLYLEAGITNIDALEAACKAGNIRRLKGFGNLIEQKILTSIEFMRKSAGYFLLYDALVAEKIMRNHLLRSFPGLEVHCCGSVRRHLEVVSEVVLLAASDDAEAVHCVFRASPGVERVLAATANASTVRLQIDIPVTLHVVAPETLAPALLHHTGSARHLAQLQELALQQEMQLHEHGLSRAGVALPCHDEAAIYAALGLPWIAPELREGLDELEQAREHRLPQLVEQSDLRGIAHMHTTWSDGDDSMEAMVAGAQRLGFTWVGISDHSRSAHYANGLQDDRLLQQWKKIDALAERFPNIRIFKGIENDILRDGSIDYAPSVLQQFEFIIASIHLRHSMNKEEMTQRMITAVKNPFTNVLGHASGRLLLSREAYEADFDHILQTCLDEGVAVEINGSPDRLDLDWRYVRTWGQRGLKFLLTPDAHRVADLGDIFLALGIARKGGLNKDAVLNCLNADQFYQWAQQRRNRGYTKA